MKKVEAWLEDDNTAAARLALETMLTTRPKDARVRYMLGRVAYAEDRTSEALDDYTRRRSRSIPGFRGDPVLLGHVDAMLADPKLADAALALLIDQVGAPAADLLAKVANEGSDLPRRRARGRRARRSGRGEAGRSRLARHARAAQGGRPARRRSDWVEKLRKLGDARALPALRGLRARRVGPHQLGRDRTRPA